jgi:hypothetical protein
LLLIGCLVLCLGCQTEDPAAEPQAASPNRADDPLPPPKQFGDGLFVKFEDKPPAPLPEPPPKVYPRLDDVAASLEVEGESDTGIPGTQLTLRLSPELTGATLPASERGRPTPAVNMYPAGVALPGHYRTYRMVIDDESSAEPVYVYLAATRATDAEASLANDFFLERLASRTGAGDLAFVPAEFDEPAAGDSPWRSLRFQIKDASGASGESAGQVAGQFEILRWSGAGRLVYLGWRCPTEAASAQAMLTEIANRIATSLQAPNDADVGLVLDADLAGLGDEAALVESKLQLRRPRLFARQTLAAERPDGTPRDSRERYPGGVELPGYRGTLTNLVEGDAGWFYYFYQWAGEFPEGEADSIVEAYLVELQTALDSGPLRFDRTLTLSTPAGGERDWRVLRYEGPLEFHTMGLHAAGDRATGEQALEKLPGVLELYLWRDDDRFVMLGWQAPAASEGRLNLGMLTRRAAATVDLMDRAPSSAAAVAQVSEPRRAAEVDALAQAVAALEQSDVQQAEVQLIAASLLGDNVDLSKLMRLCPSLGRPTMAVRWAVGLSHVQPLGAVSPQADAPAQPDDGQTLLPLAEFDELTFGSTRQMIELLTQAARSGDFGRLQKNAMAAAAQGEHRAVVTLVGDGDAGALLERARQSGSDVLLIAGVIEKSGRRHESRNRRPRDNPGQRSLRNLGPRADTALAGDESSAGSQTLTWRAVDVGAAREIWRSSPISSAQVAGAQGGRLREDPLASAVRQFQSLLEAQIYLMDMPSIDAERARRRVAALVELSRDRQATQTPWSVLAEIQLYRGLELLSAAEVRSLHASLLGAETAEVLATGELEEKQAAIAELMRARE